MNLTFVETFYWAAVLKSVSDAAKKMNIVPQAASQRIRGLEDELGVPLLDRHARVFRLTQAGEHFRKDAERLLRLWREIQPNYCAKPSTAATLRIGAIESVLHSWLIPWIERVRAQRPTITFQLTTETSPALQELVVRGSLDLVVGAEAVYEESVRTYELPSMPMVFVGRRQQHTQASYTLVELASYELLTFQRSSQPYIKLLELLAKHNLQAAQVHAISSISAMLQLVVKGFGVATLPMAAVESLSDAQGLVPLCCESELEVLPLFASWRTDPGCEAVDSIARSMVAFVEEQTSLAQPSATAGVA
jgi:DNA-binding transcriptional LysR family regulator